MLTIKSDKTSLLDLSIRDLRNVAWEHLRLRDFEEDFKNPKLLGRLKYIGNDLLVNFSYNDVFLMNCPEEFIEAMIIARIKNGERRFCLDSSMFYDRKQYSIEFLTKYAEHLPMNYAEHQKSITPEFLDRHYDRMDTGEFWGNFGDSVGMDKLSEFLTYSNGRFKDEMLDSSLMRYCTKDDLIALNMTVPNFYDNVMTEQRVMSGDPCNDGQRSFSIWLRKYRRVNNDPNGFPTWNDLLELYKKYPRMNQHGYVDWLHHRAVTNDERYVNEYPEHLSYSPKEITFDGYRHVAGEENQKEDFEIEFADVNETPDNSTSKSEEQPAQSEDQTVEPDVAVAVAMPNTTVRISRDPATGRFVSTRN